MARVSEYSVVFEEEVLRSLLYRYTKAYPNEGGAFLFGEHWSYRWNIPYVTSLRSPKGAEADTWSWDFKHEDFIRETKLAAARGQMLLGWSHSHPWKEACWAGTHQSVADARTQTRYRLSLSLIFLIYRKGWWADCWKEGLACPLNILVKNGSDELKTLRQWSYLEERRNPWKDLPWKK